MKKGDTVYVRYIGNIRHWSKGLFTALIAAVDSRYVTVNLNGDLCRFDKNGLRHESKHPSYRLYLTAADYEQETEQTDLKNLMAHTNFTGLSIEKQRAIKAIIES